MARAVEQRGRVEVVHGQAAQHLSAAGEGLAAFLRYPWPVDVLPSTGAEPVLTSGTARSHL
jgi:hypothetical protein